MVFSFFGRRALSLAVVSLLASSALGEVFEQLNAVPDGEFSGVPWSSLAFLCWLTHPRKQDGSTRTLPRPTSQFACRSL